MLVPHLLPSKLIRQDGIYFSVTFSSDTVYKGIPESFYFDGVAISSNGRFFKFSHNFERKDWVYEDYGVKGALKNSANTIMRTSKDAIYPKLYQTSYFAHDLIASYKSSEFEETITCSLYSTNQLKVEIYLNHFDNDFIENKGDYLFNFISLYDIEKGITESEENALYPTRNKKKWWHL